MISLSELVYESLTNAAINGKSDWGRKIDDVTIDLLTYDSNIEEFEYHDVRRAVMNAMNRHLDFKMSQFVKKALVV